jgi:hypothetical protein
MDGFSANLKLAPALPFKPPLLATMGSEMSVGIPRGITASQGEKEEHIMPTPRVPPRVPPVPSPSPDSEREADSIMRIGLDTRAARAERMHHERLRQEDKLLAKRLASTDLPVSMSFSLLSIHRFALSSICSYSYLWYPFIGG